MVDAVLLDAIRRFMLKAEVESEYEKVLTAYAARRDDVTVIIGKGSESDSANAQVVITREDYREWLAVFEARLNELAAEESSAGELVPGEHIDFSKRRVTT